MWEKVKRWNLTLFWQAIFQLLNSVFFLFFFLNFLFSLGDSFIYSFIKLQFFFLHHWNNFVTSQFLLGSSSLWQCQLHYLRISRSSQCCLGQTIKEVSKTWGVMDLTLPCWPILYWQIDLIQCCPYYRDWLPYWGKKTRCEQSWIWNVLANFIFCYCIKHSTSNALSWLKSQLIEFNLSAE